jgi:DNA-binding transcriptional MerR regulator
MPRLDLVPRRVLSGVLASGGEAATSWDPSYTISEISRVARVPVHILRYWETCRLLDPPVTARGHRRYRQKDLERIRKIKDLICIRGLGTDGARKALSEESRRLRTNSQPALELAMETAASAVLRETKSALREILQILK